MLQKKSKTNKQKTLVTNNQADLATPVLVAAAHHGSHRVVHHSNRTDVIVLQGETETSEDKVKRHTDSVTVTLVGHKGGKDAKKRK